MPRTAVNSELQTALVSKPRTLLNSKVVNRYMEDITCPRVDMIFIFEWSTRYLTSERSELVRYRVEHEKIIFISICGHVKFCLLYKHAYDHVIDYFPKISEDFPKFVRRPDERFRTFSEHFPKITEDCRGRTDVSIIQQDILVLSQRLRS